MIDDFDSSTSTIRLLVSQALKEWPVEGLLRLLYDDDVIVRTGAARELQIRGGDEVFHKVLQYLDDASENVREISAFTLGQLGTPDYPFRKESISALLRLAPDSSGAVRASVAAAIGHLCYESMPSEAEDVLLHLAKDPDTDVRACAAYALGNATDSPRVATALSELERDLDDEVRSYAELGQELVDEKRATPKR